MSWMFLFLGFVFILTVASGKLLPPELRTIGRIFKAGRMPARTMGASCKTGRIPALASTKIIAAALAAVVGFSSSFNENLAFARENTGGGVSLVVTSRSTSRISDSYLSSIKPKVAGKPLASSGNTKPRYVRERLETVETKLEKVETNQQALGAVGLVIAVSVAMVLDVRSNTRYEKMKIDMKTLADDTSTKMTNMFYLSTGVAIVIPLLMTYITNPSVVAGFTSR